MTRLSVFEPDRICNSHGNIFAVTNVGLQAALDDLDSRGGTVWIPPENIPITTTVDVDNPREAVSIIGTPGDSADDLGTVLECLAGFNDEMMQGSTGVADPNKEINLYGITFNGNNTTPATALCDFPRLARAKIERCGFRYSSLDGLRVGDAGNLSYYVDINSCEFLDCAVGYRTVNHEEGFVRGCFFGSNTDAMSVGAGGIKIINNQFTEQSDDGIVLTKAAGGVVITGNHWDKNADACILATDDAGTGPDRVVVSDNIFFYPSYGDSGNHDCIQTTGTCDGWVVHDNIVRESDAASTNFRYFINLNSGSDWLIHDNNLSEGMGTIYYNLPNLDHYFKLAKFPFHAVNGTGSTQEEDGVEINAASEAATAYWTLPLNAWQVYGIRIRGKSNVADAEEMHLEIRVYGAADNQPYNTHTATLTNQDSVTTNFAANDNIYWESTDSAILAWQRGDWGYVHCLYESGVEPDCATDVNLQTLEVLYLT